MKKLILVTVLIITVVIFSSCEEKQIDSQRPAINLKSPVEHESIKPGTEIHFDAVLTDDLALKSYKINIHASFDGHNHSASTRASTDSVAFDKTWTEADFVKLGDEAIFGKKEVNLYHHHMAIPTEIGGKPLKEGHYHFIIYCTDEAGNESSVASEIEISYNAEEHLPH